MSRKRRLCRGPQHKIIYLDAEDARMGLALAVMAYHAGKLDKLMLRFYVCQYDDHYHLTSTPLRVAEKQKAPSS